MIVSNWQLYRFAWSLGIVSLIKGHITSGVKQLLAPILYWRFPEFSECLSAIDAIGHKRLNILDIGSPKLLSLFLAIKRSNTVYATDIQDEDIFKRYKEHYDDWLSLKGAMGDYKVELQDARSLRYDDNSFDVVFSLEVLGHIPDEGDIVAMREIHRVLKKDGIAIIALPYAQHSKDIFVKNNVYERAFEEEPIFYLRQYDEQSLKNRIIESSELDLVKKIHYGERLPFDSKWENIPAKFKIPFMWTEAMISRINLKTMNIGEIQKDITAGYKRIMNCILVLSKR